MKSFIKTIALPVIILTTFPAICFAEEASSKVSGLNFTVPEFLLPVDPKLHKAITNPACSYVFDQHNKGFVRNDDRVVAWIRGNHNGGAIPLRHFLSVPRVLNDTYGIFFYDADGGYVSAFQKDADNHGSTKFKGYEFVGWRDGVMIVKSPDNTLWSALSGRGLEGPRKGERLKRVPNLMTNWGHWLMLHPESVAYNMYDGKKYPKAELPTKINPIAKKNMKSADDRLPAGARVLGVETPGITKAFPLDKAGERASFMDKIDGKSVVVFWYEPTDTAVAYQARLGDRELTFYADKKSPGIAPFKDRETNSRWTIAGRAIDGPLKGSELKWINCVQSNWYAWASEYPKTELFRPKSNKKLSQAR